MKDLTDYNLYKENRDLKDYLAIKLDPMKFLYEDKGRLIVMAEHDFKGTLYFDVRVMDEDCYSGTKTPDCKIENYSMNIWTRTERGCNAGTYKSLPMMLREVSKCLEKKIGSPVSSFVIKPYYKRRLE